MTRIPEEFFAPPQRGEEPLFIIDQDSAVEFVYGILARACKDGRPPSLEEGRSTVELEPQTPNWDALGLIAYPQPGSPDQHEPEPIATAQLCKAWDGMNFLEYVKEHRIFFHEGRYWGSQTPLLLDAAHDNVTALGAPSQITQHDLKTLGRFVNISPVREIELF